MNTKRVALIAWEMVLAATMCVVADRTARAQEKTGSGGTSVIMEESTVRGKVVILETRRDDRKTVDGIRIEVRSTDEDKLLHETETDEAGLFALPLLKVGEYRLVVGELRLKLLVQPKAPERAGQEEPKTLLIMMPKEVI